MAKLGIVLSGGGAKGAYHVGVLKAIQELGLEIDMLAGASIGTLNGAVLLSADNFDQGIYHLDQLWDKLPQIKPIQIKGLDSLSEHVEFNKKLDTGTYISLLLASGLKLATPIGWIPTFLGFLFNRLNIKSVEGFCKQEPLSEMMQEFLNLEKLKSAIPFYISTYKIKDREDALENFFESLNAIKDFVKAELLGLDNQYSEFYKIQNLSPEDQKKFILASAALPLIFQPQQDSQGYRFVDGGLGGALKAQGNTPITPLIEAGCSHIIVVHLDHGALWHRHDFPDINILEIRPDQQLSLNFKNLLDFSEESITLLRKQGYIDAKKELNRFIEAFGLISDISKNRVQVLKSLDQLSKSESDLDDVMKSL
ncbi:patatin-like phospholipase family protein [Acinetobacter sp. Marseille-Q1623]|uniref:patatin-like phospholipase family protein n=1 Tax=Acinetobacter sp. Marseille-Q1623 TaxID=2697501 RepID=UPI00157A77ED|nr:patatin-like phospholipase family protein [Acinetobacter sp. Marseille-Q1623]